MTPEKGPDMLRRHITGLSALALVAGLAACATNGTGETEASATVATVDEIDLAATIDNPDDINTPDDIDTAIEAEAVSVDDTAGLIWMREEEQLAHDVYTILGEEWGLQIFENIAASEQSHIDAVVGLLDRYGIDDPAADHELGTFNDPTLQQLYDDLVARGLESVEAALTVGATIEELDIDDLRVRSEATDEAAIVDVYARLERGSRNHLRAFVGQLDLLGAEYQPSLLDDDESIISTPTERGGGRSDH